MPGGGDPSVRDTGSPPIAGRSASACRIALIRADLTFEIPPGLIASSISSTGARITASHDCKRSRKRRYATSRLRSFVLCDSTVNTSSAIGSPCGAISGMPYTARRRSRIRLTPQRVGGALSGDRAPPHCLHGVTTSSDGSVRFPELYTTRPWWRRWWRPMRSTDDWLEVPDYKVGFLERSGGLAVDLPGFGRSGKPGYLKYTIDEYARFIERFLDFVEVERVRLVMHDWGAVGLAFAQAHPERVERLVVLKAAPLLSRS